MIFNVLAGGKGKALCYFRGAVSETLTIQQDSVTVATVSTNERGITTSAIELKPGTYTITGSVSGYTKTVTIKKDGTYNAYPDGAIYWYGTEIYPITVTKGGDSGSYATTGKAEKQTNSLYLYVSTRGNAGSTYYATACTTGAIDTSGYSTIRFITTKGGAAYTNSRTVGHKSASGYGRFSNTNTDGTNAQTTVTSPGTTTFLGATADATTYGPVYSVSELTVHAIFME